MNRKYLSVVLCATLFCMNSSQAVEESLSDIHDLVEAVAAQADSIRCRKPDVVGDHFYVLRKFKEVSELEEKLVSRWRDVLANLDSVADTEMEKAIVLVACGKLTEGEYVEFLGVVLSLVEQGRLDRQFFSFVENPVDETSEGWAVLVRRADEPSVQSIIKRASSLFQDRADVVHEFDQMLNGESRRKWDKQNPIQAAGIAKPEDVSASSIRQSEEGPVKAALVEETPRDKQKRGLVLPVVAGIIAVLACAGGWIFRRHG